MHLQLKNVIKHHLPQKLFRVSADIIRRQCKLFSLHKTDKPAGIVHAANQQV